MRDDENLTAERPTFVTHLECSATGARYAADELHNLSRERKPLIVRYDLDGVKKALSKEALARRPSDLWRYRELLPAPATSSASASRSRRFWRCRGSPNGSTPARSW